MATYRVDPLVAERLETLITCHGGVRAAAKATGLNACDISATRLGRQAPRPSVLRAIGLRSRVVYDPAPGPTRKSRSGAIA